LGGDVFDLAGDVDPTDEDGDITMDDSMGVSTSLDGEIFSGGKKYRESIIGDSDNTGDGGKIAVGIEKAKLFMEFMEKRRKFFATKRDEEKRNKPPTKAQQRSIMSTYLKNMDG
nr:hypothetical protein [Tanacetum cinerariifolium]